MLNYIVWDVNPVAFSPFGLEIRWYGILFAVAFLLGWWILARMLKMEGRKTEMADILLWYVAVAVIVGARLGHCLFYEPQWYLSHPLDILKIRDGGLASHGAAIGILIALWLVSRKYKTSIWYWLDRVVVPVALSGFFIRMGNLMNSEIYGHITHLPWGFIFVREGEILPKHPTQIYEALCYLLLFTALILHFHTKKSHVRNGQMFGWFLIGCFGSRFLIEFLKEVQVDWEYGHFLDMGQILSIPFILGGIAILITSHKGLLDKKS